MVKVGELYKGFRGWDAFAMLVFGEQCLFDPGFHLYSDLRVSFLFAKLAQPFIHHDHPDDIMS